jgi:NADPH:quinone reductase
MRAVTVRDKHLRVEEMPDPVPGAGEVLVRVRAAGINGADMHQRRGLYPAPPGAPQDIPGLGGVPEVFTTAHDAIFTQADLQPGEHLLVHGAAGGVGTAAVQLAVAAGARVTATVRNPELRDQVAEFGAEVIAPENFGEHGPFDVILELIGAPNLGENVNALSVTGRIVVIGIGAGAKGDLHLGALMAKRARIHGSMLRPRPLEEKALTARAMERSVLPLLEQGLVRVPIAATYALEQAEEAYDHFAAGGKLGKIVLVMDR